MQVALMAMAVKLAEAGKTTVKVVALPRPTSLTTAIWTCEVLFVLARKVKRGRVTSIGVVPST
jgi:hypothetical protein